MKGGENFLHPTVIILVILVIYLSSIIIFYRAIFAFRIAFILVKLSIFNSVKIFYKYNKINILI